MKPLDVLRGAYVRAPAPLRAAVGGVLGRLPPALVYGRAYAETRRAIERTARDPDAALGAVRAALTDVLDRAATAPGNAPVAPAADPFDRLARFPVLTKDDLRARGETLVARPRGRLDLVTTSGSSGQPLGVWLDRDRGVREQAFIHAAWAPTGYRAGRPRLVLRGVQIADVDRTTMEWEAGLRELRCSPFHLTAPVMDRFVAEAERRGIAHVHGYPSAIAILARHLLATGHGWGRRVEGVLPISEPLYDGQRALFADAFPNAIVAPFYGMTEKVAFAATDAARPDVYRFMPLYGWAELVDADGRAVAVGQTGRLVSTGFVSRGMPLVRYDTGDDATLVEPASAANGWRLAVRDLVGRWRPEYLVSADGALISIAALNVHSATFAAIREYQFVQDAPGRARLLAVLGPGAPADTARRYAEEVARKVGRGIAFEAEVVDAIEPGARGKRRYIRQSLDLSRYGVDG